MEFYIKTRPEFIDSYQVGIEIKLSMGDRFIWVTVSKIEDDNVFIKAIGKDEIYLQSLLEEKTSTFSIRGV
jgi:hypothetical protein